MSQKFGFTIIIAGIILIIIGGIIWTGALKWFGNLPGDIKIERESTRIYIPLTSMLLTSLAISIILYFFKKCN